MRMRLLAVAIALAAVVAGPAVVPAAAQDSGEWGTSFWVPTYQQQRNLSCEYAALVIAMGAYGTWVSEYQFDDLVGWSDNPHWGFRGDINGPWGSTDDYGVYAEPLAAALPNFGFWGDVFYAQGDASALTARLDQGFPTLVWIGDFGNDAFWAETDGTWYQLAAGEHVVVAYGYDANGVYVSDPAAGSDRFLSWDDFMTMWNVLDGMSLAVGPM